MFIKIKGQKEKKKASSIAALLVSADGIKVKKEGDGLCSPEWSPLGKLGKLARVIHSSWDEN